MKIAPARSDAFLQQLPDGLRVVLIYGPDHGLAGLRANQIAAQIVSDRDDPFRISRLSVAEIAADPARLADDMAAQSLIGGRRLVRVSDGDDKILPALTALLNTPRTTDTLLLVEAGELEARSKLRALAESDDPSLAALACYPDEGPARLRLIAEILRQAGLAIDQPALEHLALVTPPDRVALLSELEKLMLYVHGAPRVTLQDVQAALGDGAEADFDQAVMAAGEGKIDALDRALQRLLGDGVGAVAILRATQRHFLRLFQARQWLDDGLDAKAAMAKLQPRVFWKAENSFAAQLRRWPTAQLTRALNLLTEAEAQCKRTGAPDQAICQQILFKLARSG